MPLPAGTRLGRYEVRSTLGAGGMGEVYLAWDSELEREVAVKVLPLDLAADHQRLGRFIQEAKAASALNHPNILSIYDAGQSDTSRFIVMEHVEGETLRKRLSAGPMSLREALDVAAQVASALSEAHRAGIVHRDVKPENVMVRRGGIAKVLDFGIAKLSEHRSTAPDTDAPTRALVNTGPGTVMGTVSYMSPEQARGLEVDGRTDIWALGVVLYEMVAGRPPFEGKTATDVLANILHREPASLLLHRRDVPEELERIVEKTLAKDTEERYQLAKELGVDLKRLRQRLDLEAEMERSGAPGRGTGERPVATRGGEHAATDGAEAARSGVGVHTTSSAEYIVTQIQRHKRGAGLVLAALFVAIAALGYFYFARGGKASINSVAVMPFVNVGNDPNVEYLSDGISESLINNLSQLPQLKVIARSSTFKYKGKEVDPEDVAKTLGVGAIVTGRVIQRGDDLQISVNLINAQDRTQMWGEQYNRRATDLQAVQAEIARTVSEKLRLRLPGAQEQQLVKKATENPQAYQLYLNGVFYFRKGNLEDSKKSLDYYTQAVALDPKFALAYAGMPEDYINLTFSGADPTELLAKGHAAAQKALELDGSLAEAHDAMARIRLFEWDWSGAENEFKRAIELNPNMAGAHGNYAGYLYRMGRTAEALAENRRAQELDPLVISTIAAEGVILYWARRYDEAIQVFQNVNKLQPDYSTAHVFLGYTYEAKGQYAEAIAEYQKEMSLEGETPSTLCYTGYAYAKSGKRDEALAILDKLKTTRDYVSPAELAVLYVGLGDKEAALDTLERAYQKHDLQMQYLKVDSHYDALRSEARFQDLMRKVGLPQ